MQLLPVQFTKSGFDYTQVQRTDGTAIYSQSSHGHVQSYEVVRIQRHDAHTWPDGRQSSAREAMPPSESWGTLGFTCLDFPSAQSRQSAMERPN